MTTTSTGSGVIRFVLDLLDLQAMIDRFFAEGLLKIWLLDDL
jgi:hypothetical protein